MAILWMKQLGSSDSEILDDYPQTPHRIISLIVAALPQLGPTKRPIAVS
jgi:uncharacterized protein (DUF433 family)